MATRNLAPVSIWEERPGAAASVGVGRFLVLDGGDVIVARMGPNERYLVLDEGDWALTDDPGGSPTVRLLVGADNMTIIDG